MKTKTHATTNRGPRRFVTTLGDLVSAAYDAVPGFGRQRLKGALVLLTRSPLARSINPQLRFVP